MTQTLKGLEVSGKIDALSKEVLTDDALAFLTSLQNRFNSARESLLSQRIKRQAEIDRGAKPDFLKETQAIRAANWKVTDAPPDLQDRRVEITGPVEKKMMINALNSGANVFMADFEDSLSPTWENIIQGQVNLKEAVRHQLSFVSPEGKNYKLNDAVATLVVRPRGWHLYENHVKVDGKPMSASLFDFGLYFFHNANELIRRGSGPYFYLPKLESHLEARLWNDVFNFAQDTLKIPRGTVRATVLIETILAAFEMEEILYELKDHAAGLNAGRWDYIFSMIKKFSNQSEFLLPDRAQVTMNVPFMKAYCQLLVKTCHDRGAHAMGGMAAFIPSRKDIEINKVAIAKVHEDKEREAHLGFDGTWVAHPDLVPVAKEVFDKVLGKEPHQKDKQIEKVTVSAAELLNTKIPAAEITDSGLNSNIDVALQYIESWLRGIGAAAIYNLMEDAATAEIARAQLWQWINNKARLNNGQLITLADYRTRRDALLAKLTATAPGRFNEAKEILDGLVENKTFVEFMTIPAYRYLKQ
ncbi:MAG: malate synthase A [Candidatus Melainabacteria bacterium]|nr:MAG: malate synthase A [Candidatus Melainabacteria bacterium]